MKKVKGEDSPSKTTLHQNTRHRPKGVDSSMECKGGSVDEGARRGAVAKTPKTLGPRTA